MNDLSSFQIKPTELDAVRFPLHGSRLIEASAGTGKTYTIAALFVRLVLGHGQARIDKLDQDPSESLAFTRPLLPSEILVMTFTKAATQELSSRIQSRLVEIADYFRHPQNVPSKDHFVVSLMQSYPGEQERLSAAWQLHQAALCMDEASVFTIDAWCQKVLREHAVHTGQPFDEELVVNEADLRKSAVQDFWRKTVYAMDLDLAGHMKRLFPADFYGLLKAIEEEFKNQKTENPMNPQVENLDFVHEFRNLVVEHQGVLKGRKKHLAELSLVLSAWIEEQWRSEKDQWNGTKWGQHHLKKWLAQLHLWCLDEGDDQWPKKLKEHWDRFSEAGFLRARKANAKAIELPRFINELYELGCVLTNAPTLMDKTWPLFVRSVHQEMETLKKQRGQFGFSDLLKRLHSALKSEHGQYLKAQLKDQFPVVMVDEFQDTSPIQYSIFNEIYNIEENSPDSGIFLIGDPKQSIYSFRGADIQSYLNAKRATYPRHYVLGRNFRSGLSLVEAVNQVFQIAEEQRPVGAFAYRHELDNPLPFIPVQAQGLSEQLCTGVDPLPAITTLYTTEVHSAKEIRRTFANSCASQVVHWLNSEDVRFKRSDQSKEQVAFQRRLMPADIAILVRTGVEAQAIRSALNRRGVASVYLSDKDSVFKTQEARDLAYWMRAVLAPMDTLKVKTALALPLLNLSTESLLELNEDGYRFDQYADRMKELGGVWLEHGILAMIRKTLSVFELPVQWLQSPHGQRKLSNVLQLSELLQAQSVRVHGQKGLLDWLIHALSDESSDAEEHILRLESDAQLVKVVTIHKSKGLEFNVVMLPFATTFNSRDQSVEDQGDDALEEESFSQNSSLKGPSKEEASRENIRLLYVALTRAKHALWLGFSRLNHNGKGACVTHQSALGALMANGEALAEESTWTALLQTFLSRPCMQLVELNNQETSHEWLASSVDNTELKAPLIFSGEIDRNFKFSSFSSLMRWQDVGEASVRSEASLPADDEPLGLEPQLPYRSVEMGGTLGEMTNTLTLNNRLQSAHPYLAIAGGMEVGNFMHELLRWSLADCKTILKTPGFHAKLIEKIELLLPSKIRAQAQHISSTHELSSEFFAPDDLSWLVKTNMTKLVFKWVCKILYTSIDDLAVSMSTLKVALAETEFWMSCEHFLSEHVELIVAESFLPNMPRKPIQASDWHGMLMGFADLLFECDGKYYVLDYKTNTLGLDLKDYELEALQRDVLDNRYDLQAAIYLLALHQLLQSRLAGAYDPEVHLGGAYVWYLRGVGSKGQGLCLLKPSAKMMLSLASVLKHGNLLAEPDNKNQSEQSPIALSGLKAEPSGSLEDQNP